MTALPPQRPTTRQRKRRQRIRIAIELAVGGAAIWFVTHPVAFPQLRQPDAIADSTAADSADDVRDTSATSAPFGRSPKSALPITVLPRGRLFRSVEERARAGDRVAVSVTAYCLQGRTRRDHLVRDGIIAVDRRLFPLGRDVDLYFGRTKYGRFLADDTGGAIKGAIIDVWMADCNAARRFGRRRGYAQLVRSGK